MTNNKTYKVLGLMSGTSLDGVDIAFCEFINNEKNEWSFKIKQAKTYVYDAEWKDKLKNAHKLDLFDFVKLHKDYGHYLGKLVQNFVKEYHIKADCLSSHGHTVFHQPANGLTFQLGEGASIAVESRMQVICDFRTTDIALGGQGAPLVPIGDKLLFSEYDYCLNLGGFANISLDANNKRIAYDICPVNIVLNMLAIETGNAFDDKGKIASKGNMDTGLYDELNDIEFYKLNFPKSLSREWVEMSFLPILNKYNISVQDKLRTIIEHIAFQISNSLDKHIMPNNNSSEMLVTGGGAYNDYLIEKLRQALGQRKETGFISIQKPENNIIDFKEAMIFAFLGVLRLRNEINCLSSVTGAERDNTGGCVYTL